MSDEVEWAGCVYRVREDASPPARTARKRGESAPREATSAAPKDSAGCAESKPPRVGTRSIVMTLTEREIVALVGAPAGATVELRPGNGGGLPSERMPGTVVIKWSEP